MKLPDVFVNPINKHIKNVQNSYEGTLNDYCTKEDIPLINKINNIFNDKHFVYKKRVRITTSKGSEEKIVVGKTNTALLSLDGSQIKINDIYDIEIV